MNKKELLIILSLISTSAFSQLGLFNEGGDGLIFHIGQDDAVQAESDITNLTGATIEFENGGTPALALKGNFLNSTSGTYTLGTETIEFNGAALQSADFGGDDIYGLLTNNASNISIDRHVTITGSLDYSTGHLISTTSAYPTIETTGVTTGADDDSHNNGPIAKNFDATTEFTYPVGNGTNYRYSTFTPASASAVTIRSTYYGAAYADYSYNAPIYKISRTEYWDMYRTSGAINGVVSLSWDTESGGVTTIADLLIAYYDGTDWTTAGGNNHTGNTTAGDVESNADWSIYDRYFTLATSSADNALPVELTRFEAEKEKKTARLEWETTAEINSDYFSIQKSTNGIDFTEISQVGAAGTSTETVSYYNYDFNPLIGKNYYKLVIIDQDGTSEESKIRVVQFDGNGRENLAMNIFPNPAQSVANFNYTAPEDGIYYIKVFSITGKLVYSANVLGVVGKGQFNLNVSTFESGKYIVQFLSPSGEVINNSIGKI